jgi:pyrimidine and pyridine-specific 5'-nucleotidase
MDFEEKCFSSIPLKDMLSPDLLTRKLLEDIDRSKCHVWAFTNSYRRVRASRLFAAQINPEGLTGISQHAERVLQALGLWDQFEGVVFCDYNENEMICKPEAAFYRRVCLHPSHIMPLSDGPGVSGYGPGRSERSGQMPLR